MAGEQGGVPRILALAGSMRADSFNKKLLRVAAGVAKDMGAAIDWVELRELNLPLYDGDIEASTGLPEAAVRFKERIQAAEGLLLACPEYNHSLPGVFKNAIDWASRAPGNVFANKAAAMVGASSTASGALRALMQLRLVLAGRGAWVVPAQATLSNAGTAFDESGALKDASVHKQVVTAVQQLLAQIQRMRTVPG